MILRRGQHGLAGLQLRQRGVHRQVDVLDLCRNVAYSFDNGLCLSHRGEPTSLRAARQAEFCRSVEVQRREWAGRKFGHSFIPVLV